jgi:hypothetical protein
MSQAKVDKYKQEKYNRKNAKKKTNIKKIFSYVVATLIGIAFVVYIGYSIAVSTGLYTPPITTTHVELSQSELESLRNTLIQNGDSNVKGDTSISVDTTTAAEETTDEDTTTEESTEETGTVDETTAE